MKVIWYNVFGVRLIFLDYINEGIIYNYVLKKIYWEIVFL